MSLDLATVLRKQVRPRQSQAIIIEIDNNFRIKISLTAAEKELFTCQWLLSEAIHRIREEVKKRAIDLDISKIVALKTKNQILSLDYWLTFPNKTLSLFEDGIVLVPVFGYSKTIREQKKQLSQLSRDDFVYEAQVGKGGFATVHLGNVVLVGFV